MDEAETCGRSSARLQRARAPPVEISNSIHDRLPDAIEQQKQQKDDPGLEKDGHQLLYRNPFND